MGKAKTIKIMNPDLTQLKQDAPLTTRTDVNFFVSYTNEYYTPASLVNSNYGCPFDIEEMDCIGLEKGDVNSLSKIVHEGTHSYNWRFAKEARGYAKLCRKIRKNPELSKKLSPILEELEKGIIDLCHARDEVHNELHGLDEAIAYACEVRYGELPPAEKRHSCAFNKGRYDACTELVSLLGIDGARAFVRDKMRKIYTTQKVGTWLEHDVKDYKEKVIAFFEQVDGETK
jgi:hypothetical protein